MRTYRRRLERLEDAHAVDHIAAAAALFDQRVLALCGRRAASEDEAPADSPALACVDLAIAGDVDSAVALVRAWAGRERPAASTWGDMRRDR